MCMDSERALILQLIPTYFFRACFNASDSSSFLASSRNFFIFSFISLFLFNSCLRLSKNSPRKPLLPPPFSPDKYLTCKRTTHLDQAAKRGQMYKETVFFPNQRKCKWYQRKQHTNEKICKGVKNQKKKYFEWPVSHKNRMNEWKYVFTDEICVCVDMWREGWYITTK